MLKKRDQRIEWLEFELFKEFKEITQGVFLRKGGKSTGECHAFSLAYQNIEDRGHVDYHREELKRILDIPYLAFANQKHTAICYEIKGIPADEIVCKQEPCDALITKEKGIGLVILHADCQVAILYDTKQKVIAAIHSGWRGSVENIYQKTITFLQKTHDSDPKDMLVGISPSLGPNASEFINYRKELPEAFYSYQIKPCYFDFWAISMDQLTKAGIPKGQIEIARICTYTNPDDFYSYRRDKITGRNATVIAMS